MKGLFIPEITAEMFRNGCLESIEALMAEGEIFDVDYYPKAENEKEDVLDKVRAEIEKERTFQRAMDEHDIATGLRKALEIIDKFKAESEEED